MKLTLRKDHLIHYIVTHAYIEVTGDVSSKTSNFKVSFIATQRGVPRVVRGRIVWDKIALIKDQVIQEIEVNDQPFDLYVLLRNCVHQSQLIERANGALSKFNSMFIGTLEGLDMRIKLVEM